MFSSAKLTRPQRETASPLGTKPGKPATTKPQTHINPVWHQLATRIQSKPAVSMPGDPYEQEADHVADQVMRMPEPRIQRQCAACATGGASCPKCEEGQKLMRKPADGDRFADNLGTGRPLEPSEREFFEPRFGHDFGDVLLHTDARAADSARSVNALAYTHGRNVVFGHGQFDSSSAGGRRLLAHELAHVVQQRGTEASIQRMAACPSTLKETDPTPPGWKPYFGNSSVFHCGYKGILENRAPTPTDPMNECFYDHSGTLVDEKHPYAGCRGTPDYFDSSSDPVRHFAVDPGGIVQAGGPAFVTSRIYDLTNPMVVAIQTIATAATTAANIAQSVTSILGNAIALGVLTAQATVEPGNWNFQGLPARSVRHLNVMGAIIGSTGLNQNPNTLLQNLTRHLDSFPIADLLGEIAQDVNQALKSRGSTTQITSAQLGSLSMLHLVVWLQEQGVVKYTRPPEDIASERLAALGTATP